MCAPKKDFVQNLHNNSSAESRVLWIKIVFKIWFISGKLRGFSLEAGKRNDKAVEKNICIYYD